MLPNSPGSRRFLGELMDYADANDGGFPQTKSLGKYTDAEARDVRSALKRDHYGQRGSATIVHVHRLLADQESPAAFRAMVCKALGRQPVDRLTQTIGETKMLHESIDATALSPQEKAVLHALLPERRGWIGRSLRQDGLSTTKRRIESYSKILIGLPRPEQEPLRQHLARTLRDSHALDDDTILAGAISRRLEARNPDLDVDDAYLAEGLQRRIASGVAVIHGVIAFSGPSPLQTPATTSIALTEDFLAAHVVTQPLPRVAVTVENPSAWETLRHAMPKGYVAILTDGYPTRAVQRLAAAISVAGVTLLHWGDVDDGGFRILGVLSRQASAQPLLMDADTVTKHEDRLTRFTPAKPRVSNSHPALERANQLGGWLEQENVEVADALAQIGRRLGQS